MDVVTLSVAWVSEVASTCSAVARVVLPLTWTVLIALVKHRATMLALALWWVPIVMMERLDNRLGLFILVELTVVVEAALLALLVDEV